MNDTLSGELRMRIILCELHFLYARNISADPVTHRDMKTNRKRKTVSDSDRKRAAFSCDRCKSRKQSCKRLNSANPIYDDKTACVPCVEAGVDCTTTMPRKKRKFFSMSETSRYQFKCMTAIVKSMFPDKDVSNTSDLVDIGRNLGIAMPELPEVEESDSEPLLNQEKPTSNSPSIDREENSQVFGLRGTSGILNALLGVKHTECVSTSNHTRALTLNCLSSSTSLEPLLKLVSPADANSYVDHFFSRMHQSYFIFNEVCFRRQHRALLSNSLEYLCKEDICCVYMVWILGRNGLRSANNDGRSTSLTDDVLNNFLNLIKLSLGENLLSPSLQSIRLLYVTALYFNSIEQRDAGWLLLSLASQQAIGLNLHKESHVKTFSEREQEDIRIVWWSLYKLLMSVNSSLGKNPDGCYKECDLDLPRLHDISDELFKEYYLKSVGLFKIMYRILKHRKKLYFNNQPLALENIERMMEVNSLLTSWWNSLSSRLKNYTVEPLHRFQVKLHLQYHYLYISLTLPYLVYITTKLKKYSLKNEGPLVNTICSGIVSAVEITKVIDFSAKKKFVSGPLNYDMFYGYNATMTLITALILISGKAKIDDASNINKTYLGKLLSENYEVDGHSILNAINVIRVVNMQNAGHVHGPMKSASDNIALLLEHFGLEKMLTKRFPSGDVKSPDFIVPPTLFGQDNKAILFQQDLKEGPKGFELFDFGFNDSPLFTEAFDHDLFDLQPFLEF